jgi:hypothetical protein
MEMEMEMEHPSLASLLWAHLAKRISLHAELVIKPHASLQNITRNEATSVRSMISHGLSITRYSSNEVDVQLAQEHGAPIVATLHCPVGSDRLSFQWIEAAIYDLAIDAVRRQEQEQENAKPPLLYKVDNAGKTHIYQRKTAGELLAGERILEHVISYKPMVVTPIMAIEHTPMMATYIWKIVHTGDGVVVTFLLPDAAKFVEELYPAEKSVFISETPHLEHYGRRWTWAGVV